ncbi:hypothetical protein PSH96_11155 [Pseudomonas sp. FP2338]|nr:hypothetical protein [Pseudomonas sp. FP2338]WLH86971.1 hypothetical protein PSH96_11155 [Pseudomonas sp. FP2338]
MRMFFWLLKRPPRYRHFVLLDARQVCIAFKSCRTKPAGKHWVEVERVNLSWLGTMLPSCARTIEGG